MKNNAYFKENDFPISPLLGNGNFWESRFPKSLTILKTTTYLSCYPYGKCVFKKASHKGCKYLFYKLLGFWEIPPLKGEKKIPKDFFSPFRELGLPIFYDEKI